MQLTSLKPSGSVLTFLFMAALVCGQREYGGSYTRERLQNLQANAVKFDWVKKQHDNAIAAARPWIEKSDETLWKMVPGQSLPRCIDVTWDYDFPQRPRLGCLKCGDDVYKYGNYPYTPDFANKPWKVTCPNCGVVFPTNDFGKYYESGINEQGLFDPEKADRDLLYNSEHPDPDDPLHTYGVDDGYGFVTKADDGTGRMVDRQYKYIAYYTWKYWRYIIDGVQRLSDAYIYTGDKLYARKAAILLDRIADVYPAMDWKVYADMGWYHSDGSNRIGKIEGRIWETQTLQNLAISCDKILHGTMDNPELYAFLKKQATQYELPGRKGTRTDLVANLDSGILKTGADAVMKGQIRGNQGMHQHSMVCCAIALDTEPLTSQWLDWIFAENGGSLPTTLMQLFDRDGMAEEGAPGYCFLWPGKIIALMNLLEPYTAYSRHKISRDFPNFVNATVAPWRVEILNSFTPNVGDSGATGTTDTLARAPIMAAGFQYYKNAQAARFAWEAQGGSAGELLLDPTTTHPQALNKALEQAALEYPVGERLGENMAGFGLASFEFGGNAAGTARPGGKSLWMYYGRNTGHGHLDRLNYSIFAFHTDLMPDLGYPEFANSTWKKRSEWNNNTISHNTVVVNQSGQKESWTGFPRFYTVQPGFGAVEVESRNVYPQCSDYTRTMAFVQAPGSKDAYALDIFRVAGGNDHLLSLHGPPGPVTATGLDHLVKQTSGTYAGANVPFGENGGSIPRGYSYLKNVERQTTGIPANFQIDWKAAAGYRGLAATTDIHLRAHIIGAGGFTDVALADGVPPQNKPGNPESIRYALLHRQIGSTSATKSGLRSNFVAILEPYEATPFIKSVQQANIDSSQSSGVVALRVDFTNGATDYFVSNPRRVNFSAEHWPETNGVFAWLRTENGKVTSATLTRGDSLKMGSFEMYGSGEIRGRVVAFEKDPKKPAVMQVRLEKGDASGVIGAQIVVQNDRRRNACYDIVAADKEMNTPELWNITCGPGSFVRGYADPKDYSRGFTYNIATGQRFYIPLTTVYSASN